MFFRKENFIFWLVIILIFVSSIVWSYAINNSTDNIESVDENIVTNVACIGDSLSSSFSYVRYLQNKHTNGTLNFYCYGVSGQTTGEIKNRIVTNTNEIWDETYIYPGYFDYAVVLAGINNVRQPKKVVKDLKDIYFLLDSYDVKVYAVTLLPWGGYSTYDLYGHECTQYINNFIRKSSNVEGVIDINLKLNDYQTHSLPQEFDGGDGLHLSPNGYRYMAEYIEKSLFIL